MTPDDVRRDVAGIPFPSEWQPAPLTRPSPGRPDAASYRARPKLTPAQRVSSVGVQLRTGVMVARNSHPPSSW